MEEDLPHIYEIGQAVERLEELEKQLLASKQSEIFRAYQKLEITTEDESRKTLFFHTLALGISLGRLEV